MRTRVRLLPAVIFVAGFAAAVKLGNVWQGVDGVFASPAVAGEKAVPATTGQGAEDDAAAVANVVSDLEQATDDVAERDDERGEKGDRPGAWFDPGSVTDAEIEVLQKLSQRRKALDNREKEIEVRARLLEATEKRIDSKIVELGKIHDTISALLEKHDAQQEEKLESVVNIYEKMKPKDAARIFEELDMAILLDVVERMREAKAAPIMAEMSPTKAKAMTAALAQRRALPKPPPRDR